jgi:vancomycin aglycone glucosyltransferase
MRALLSAVGTRGDVQPVLALALAVREGGDDVRLAISPNFIEWAHDLGFVATPVGIEMRAPRGTATSAGAATAPIPDLITDQFESIGSAAKGCDLILGANAHQYAARSIAELSGIPYINALYAPTALPGDDNTRAWNERSRERVNANRTRLGLAPIDDVLRHIVTDHPWLATDPTLDPLTSMPGMTVVQTGAWMIESSSPLPREVEEFLDAGQPPVYFGFGSMPAAEEVSRTLVHAARAAGRRVILSQGWAELQLIDRAPDCIAIEDVNHHALFRRVAIVVHHGGAGTTHAAARAGAPQVVVPLFGDQPFWASRVQTLGIGTSIPFAELTADRLASALHEASRRTVAERAHSIADQVIVHGATVAAQRLVKALSGLEQSAEN